MLEDTRIINKKMHREARHFLAYCLLTFGEEYYVGRVLDVGSLDINGNNRFYFGDDIVEYVGCDLVEGKNVTHVCDLADLPFEPSYFDVVISSEVLLDVHMITKMWSFLKPGGILVITTAAVRRRGSPAIVPALKKLGASIYANDAHGDIYAVATKERKWKVKEYEYT